jgi:YidC/Oxa1 family membrane protein insertase
MQKRLLAAIVLSFLVLFGYQAVFVKKAPAPLNPTGQAAAPIQTPASQPAPVNKPFPVPPPAAGTKPEAKASNVPQIGSEREASVTISTPLYQAVWSNKGGVLTSWKLKKHLEEDKSDLELVPAAAKDALVFPFALYDDSPEAVKAGLAGIAANAANAAYYKASVTSYSLKDGEKAVLRFEYADGKELEIVKAFTFYGGKYEFDVAISVKKNGQPAPARVLWGPGIRNPSQKEISQSLASGGGGITVLAANTIYRMDERKYKPEQSTFNFVNWAAYDDNYFAALFLPTATTGSSAATGSAVFLKVDVENKPSAFFLAATDPTRVFLGPKEFGTLADFGHDAKKLVRFGFLGFIAEFLFYALRFIHGFVPNWGFAIIVLTFFIKVLFFPLTYSSTKSMAKMAELQPKVKALKAKYKKSKTDIAQRREMNEEMMKLYKEHGVNPAGGCLPTLIQIPVFIGFFNLLRNVIELRHSPWIFWIKDLSVKDPTYIIPLLMGATQFISQKMTPTSADPAQARMMLIMPVVMTVFFMQFQSGLVLYWLASNVFQIGQQYVMNRMIKAKKGESHGKRRKN